VLPLVAHRTARARAAVGTFHTYFERPHWGYRLFQGYVGGALARIDRRIAVSAACAESIRPTFPGDYEVIPNGVDCRLFRPPDPGSRHVNGRPRVLFVGRLEPRTGLDVALGAMDRLAASGRSASRWSGTGRCGGGTGGSGVPIVCADNAGFRETLAGAPAHLAPAHDPAAWPPASDACWTTGRSGPAWGVEGRRVACERYHWPGVAERVERVYRAALDAPVH
jgi:glycosyltransferase involved in cell wall biosynthesis